MNDERKENLKRFLDEERRECEESWDDLKEVLQKATKHVFGKKKRKSVDWFEDQDEEIQKLLKNKELSGDRKALRDEISLRTNGLIKKQTMQKGMQGRKIKDNSMQLLYQHCLWSET